MEERELTSLCPAVVEISPSPLAHQLQVELSTRDWGFFVCTQTAFWGLNVDVYPTAPGALR